MNDAVKALLIDIRQHPAFRDLLKSVEAPQITQFRLKDAEQIETARAKWIYQSGRKDQHEAWLHLLTGEAPKGESETQEKS